MRARVSAAIVMLILGVVCSAMAQGGADPTAAGKYFGTWTGTWEGSGSGGFEITLEKGKDGAPSGKVAVTGEPTYNTMFKTLKFDGPRMTATYDFPADTSIEVALTATFESDTAKGTWAARPKSGGEVAAGTWTVKKK